MQQQFVHLRVHTEYSMVDGLLRVPALMQALPARGMRAVAVTEFGNLFSTVKIYQAALAAGIKPIIGCDVLCADTTSAEHTYGLLLLCQNEAGYLNLKRLVSKAYQEGQTNGQPIVQREWIARYHEGLIALSGAADGDIGQALLANDSPLAMARAQNWMRLFPNRFYLEIQRTARRDESYYNEQVLTLANTLQLPLVATNAVCFLDEEDYHAHEARVCIHAGLTLADPRRASTYQKAQYLKSADAMVQLFADIPHALQNTVEIAKRCTVTIDLGHSFLPNFPTPEQTSIESYLSKLAHQGLAERMEQISQQREIEHVNYRSRLDLELAVINSMGFAGYFLIVADFIQWAKQNGVPVGPGRGSGAGSLVAYALKITDLDPLHYDLLFERFLNPERVSMPDFDIDFCMEGRDRVIEYVAQKYGRQCVAQIITFGTMAAKAVVRDVGRVMAHPYGFVDKLAKMIPFEVGMTLQVALTQEAELKRRYHEEEDVRELIDLALKLEGITRNAGKHAGGVIIAPSELTDFTGVYCEQGSTQIVSQFDKDDVEAVGLVKFDFLGLRTLTIIDCAIRAINQNRQQQQLADIDIHAISLQDDSTFALLKSCQTTAVFQLESRGMKDLIHRLQPDCFEEIIALVALFRPGPLQSGMVDDFIDRKHGRARVEYAHADLEPILKPTYGVILYQEQVMQIAQVLASYTLGAADLLRRAMGKKKPEEMAKQRAVFRQGAVSRGVDEQLATAIFDLMEKFAGYGFNKSHSAAYALVAYQTAWLKANYPAYFMAAVISADMDNTDKVVIFINECEQMHITVKSPSINASAYAFKVSDDAVILYGLGAIKGVGEGIIQSIVAERDKAGPFNGLFQFCKRMDSRKLNKRVLEALIKSGSMDEWGVSRAMLFVSIEKAMQTGSQFHYQQHSGQHDMFAMFQEENEEHYLPAADWGIQKRLDGEKETLGLYLTGHPAASYQEELRAYASAIPKLLQTSGKKGCLCAMVSHVRKVFTKSGKILHIITMEDQSGQFDVVAFSEIYEQVQTIVTIGNILVIEGELSQDKFTGKLKMLATQIYNMVDARIKFAKCLQVQLTPAHATRLSSLVALLKAHPGKCMVQIRYQNSQVAATLTLDSAWRIEPSDSFTSKLSHLLDSTEVFFRYD